MIVRSRQIVRTRRSALRNRQAGHVPAGIGELETMETEDAGDLGDY